MAKRAGRKPRERGPEYQVFISHATKDKWIAVQLDKLMRERGIATYRDDRDMEGGAKVAEELRERLQKSSEVLVLWTPLAMNSEWVKLEIGLAYGFRLHIVPVRYLTDVATLPPYIRDVQSPELTEAAITKYVEDVATRAGRGRAKR